jgi:hypothetical protein
MMMMIFWWFVLLCSFVALYYSVLPLLICSILFCNLLLVCYFTYYCSTMVMHWVPLLLLHIHSTYSTIVIDYSCCSFYSVGISGYATQRFNYRPSL